MQMVGSELKIVLDTKHYWDLTKHIFRYGHKGGYDSYNGAHTVNEGT